MSPTNAQGRVNRELFESLVALKDELLRSDAALRAKVDELQARLSESLADAARLRGELVRTKDAADRSEELALSRARVIKHSDAGLEECRRDMGRMEKRLQLMDKLRLEKQAQLEAARQKGVDRDRLEMALQEMNHCRLQVANLTAEAGEARRRAAGDPPAGGAPAAQPAAAAVAAVAAAAELEACRVQRNQSMAAAEALREVYEAPFRSLQGRLEEAEREVQSRGRKLADTCLTQEQRLLSTVVGLLLVPFGLALLPLFPASRGGGGGPTGSLVGGLAGLGDVTVVLLWSATAALVSVGHERRDALVGWASDAMQADAAHAVVQVEQALHLAGLGVFGVVVALHLIALFSAPDVVAAVQAFGMWGVGLHYYSVLDRRLLWGRGRAMANSDPVGAPQAAYLGILLLLLALSSRLAGLSSLPRPPSARPRARRAWAPAGTRSRRKSDQREGGGGGGGEFLGGFEEEEDEVPSASDEEEGVSLPDDADTETAPRLPADPDRDVTQTLEEFYDSFLSRYPPQAASRLLQHISGDASAEGAGGKSKARRMALKQDAGADEVMVTKQFLRDVHTMVRVDGSPPPGKTPEERAYFVYRALEAACGRLEGGQWTPQVVMHMVTQNLGIYLYEMLVERYAQEDPSVSVLQAGHHYIDVRCNDDSGLGILLVGFFKLHAADDLGAPPWLLQAQIDVSFAAATAALRFSRPVPLRAPAASPRSSGGGRREA